MIADRQSVLLWLAPEELIHLMRYLKHSETAPQYQEEKILRIQERIKRLKESRELEERFMTLEEYFEKEFKARFQEEYGEQLEKDVSERVEKEVAERVEKEVEAKNNAVEQKLSHLIALLVQDDRISDIQKIGEDATRIPKLMEEYNLT